jgi:type IV secretion/conjugal transfer VirB4 family ATPase
MLKRIQTLRRHHQMIKTGLFSHFGDRQPQAHELLIDEGAEGHIYDLGQCQRELELNGRRFGRASFTIILYDEDPAKVRQAVAECYRAVSPEGATLIEERGNLLDAWLAAFPGNSHHNRRRFWLMDANVADLALLFAPKTGDPWNACLQSEYLALLETRTGSPYFFNLHHGEIAHALVLGPTGAGKSFLLNFLITFLQKYTPWTCIFDIGGSYAHLTRLFGGSYLKIGLEGRCRINPFTLPRTPENRLFLVAFVKVLIESSGCVLDQSDENDLYNQIDNLYEMDPDHRRLLSLANILSRKLRQALARWVQGGPYASLFDNVEDDLTFARFQTFEFEAMNDHPELIEPTLFYVLHRASATIVDPNELSTFKAFVADEAWRFLQNATIRDYIAEALRTWRRKNAAMILATQSVDELRQTPIFNVLLESCPTKLFLSNPQMDQRLYGELFHLTSTEAEQVASLVPRGEMLLKRPDFAKVLRLDVDPRSYWLFANSPAENLRRREIFDRHGFEEGLEILARSSQ